MKKSDYRKVERPSKAEFILDNIFAVELLIFPFILLIFRKPTWTSIKGAVIISVTCSALAFVGCIYFSIPSKRSKADICLNMLTIIGATSIVLYSEWFPVLNIFVLLAAAGVIGCAFFSIKREGDEVSVRTKRRIVCYSRWGIAALSIVLIVAVLGLRIQIFKEITEEQNRIIQPIERQRIEPVNKEYNV